MDRKFLVTMYTNCHFQLISVVKIKKNVAVDKKSSFIFCTRFGAQIAGNGISELPDLPPGSPRLRWQPLGYTVGYSSLTSCLLQILFKPLILYVND